MPSLLLRYARTHVPFRTADVARRWGLPESTVEDALVRLAATGAVLAGEFHPAGSGREWCHPDVLRSLRRRSLAALRREVEPVPPEMLARFLPSWQGIGATARGAERLIEVLSQLQGAWLPVSVVERDVLAARVSDYDPRMLDELISLGEVVWVGRGALGGSDGRIALFLRGDLSRLCPDAADSAQAELHARLREQLGLRGASFFNDLLRGVGGGDVDSAVDALWDMVWAGEVTNDSFAPLRALGPRRRAVRSSRRPLMRLTPPRAAGRWSLVSGAADPRPGSTERLHALCSTLLQRHGVLTREAAIAEGIAGGFAGLYPILRAMEEAGRIRRGYFVDGLGGSQFAMPGAVDRLRGERDAPTSIVAMAATDPANAYGVTVAWPESSGRAARSAGAYIVVDGGELRLFLERGGRSLLTHGDVSADHLRAIAAVAVRATGKVEIHSVDGLAVRGSPHEMVLRDAGFGASPRGLVLWADSRAAVRR
jgi:ATP-dependent Lhr-like helicase